MAEAHEGALAGGGPQEPPKHGQVIGVNILRALPEQFTVSLDSEGMTLCDGRKQVVTFGYADILRWGGSNRRFSCQVCDPDTDKPFDIKLLTPQGEVIANYLLDMIEAIMETME